MTSAVGGPTGLAGTRRVLLCRRAVTRPSCSTNTPPHGAGLRGRTEGGLQPRDGDAVGQQRRVCGHQPERGVLSGRGGAGQPHGGGVIDAHQLGCAQRRKQPGHCDQPRRPGVCAQDAGTVHLRLGREHDQRRAGTTLGMRRTG